MLWIDDVERSAQGFLTFINGYTVFLGPFAGIMVTDVSTTPTYPSSSPIDDDENISTGSCTSARWTCLRCTDPMDGIATPTAA